MKVGWESKEGQLGLEEEDDDDHLHDVVFEKAPSEILRPLPLHLIRYLTTLVHVKNFL